MDGKDKVTKGDAAASAGQKDAKAQGQVELQEDVGMWDSNSMEGGLIFEKAAAELRQSEDPDKKAGAGSLSRVVRAASLNKLVELLTSDEEHGSFLPPYSLLLSGHTLTNRTRAPPHTHSISYRPALHSDVADDLSVVHHTPAVVEEAARALQCAFFRRTPYVRSFMPRSTLNYEIMTKLMMVMVCA